MNFIHEESKKSLEEMKSKEYVQSLKERKHSLSNSELKSLHNMISFPPTEGGQESLEKLKKGIFLHSVWYGDDAILIARKKSVFYYSKWDGVENRIVALLEEVKSYDQFFSYSQDTLDYLDNKLKLSWLHDYYRKTKVRLEKYLREFHNNRDIQRFSSNLTLEESQLKNLLVFLDGLFLSKIYPRVHNDEELNTLRHYTDEEIGEAVSYLVFLCKRTLHNMDKVATKCSKKTIYSCGFKKMIRLSCKMKKVEEWESNVDLLDYQVITQNRKTTFFHKNPEIPKSLLFANLLRDSQEVFIRMNTFSALENTALSLVESCHKCKDKVIEHFITKVDTLNFPRYCLEYPTMLFKDFWATENFFLEEIATIDWLSDLLMMPYEKVLSYKISQLITLKDVILFQRFFIIIDCCQQFYEELEEAETRLLHSLVPIHQRDQLIEILSIFLPVPQVCEAVLDFFTYEEGKLLDLQYTPILKKGNELLCPTFLLSRSNLVRNAIMSSRHKNLNSTNQGNDISMIEFLKEIFKNCSYPYQTVDSHKILSKNGKTTKGECDFIVISDSEVILFECKDSFHPAKSFEFRATLDHMRKAEKQLNLLKEIFLCPEFIKEFYESKKITQKERHISTCILSSNRLFHGTHYGTHPVRHIRELNMLLTRGRIGLNEQVWSIWDEGIYSPLLLTDYLLPDYKLKKAMFGASQPYTSSLHGRDQNISCQSYRLVPSILEHQCESLFQKKKDSP